MSLARTFGVIGISLFTLDNPYLRQLADSAVAEGRRLGYEVRVDELANAIADVETGKWIYVDPKETREKYPIPSAYEVYAAKLSMIRGKKRFLEED